MSMPNSLSFYRGHEMAQTLGWPETFDLSSCLPVTEPRMVDHIAWHDNTVIDVVDEIRPQDHAVAAIHEVTFSIESFGDGAESGDWAVGLLRNGQWMGLDGGGELIGMRAVFPSDGHVWYQLIDLRNVHTKRPAILKRGDVLSLAVLEVPKGKLSGLVGIKAHIRGVSFGRRTWS